MQIHELTQKKLNEGALSDITAFAQAALNKNPNMAGMTFTQRMKSLANDSAIQKLSQVMAQQWLTKAGMLQKQMAAQQPAAQQPAAPTNFNQVRETQRMNEVATKLPEIDETTYLKYLTDFVNKTMFRGQMRYLDAQGKSMVDQDLQQITKFRNDPAKVTQLFMPLAQTAALSVMTTPGALQTAPAAPAKAAPGAAAPAAAITADSIRQSLTGLGINVGKAQTPALSQFFERESGDIRLNKTGNAHADALLQLFGFLPQ